MGWPQIPDVIFTDRVRSRKATWGKDAVAARRPTYGDAWSAPIRCSVSAIGVSEAAAHGREEMTVSHVVTMQSDPVLVIRDQLLWAETGAILTVVGVEPAGDANGRIWNVYVEEHPQR